MSDTGNNRYMTKILGNYRFVDLHQDGHILM